jgi:hypothetical protein
MSIRIATISAFAFFAIVGVSGVSAVPINSNFYWPSDSGQFAGDLHRLLSSRRSLLRAGPQIFAPRGYVEVPCAYALSSLFLLTSRCAIWASLVLHSRVPSSP